MLRYDRLINLRKDHGLIQQDMADKLSVTRTAYNKYEKGKAQPPVDALAILADFFGVSTDYLLGITDAPAPPGEKNVQKKAPVTFDEMREAYIGLIARERGVNPKNLDLSSITPEEWDSLERSILAMIKGYGQK